MVNQPYELRGESSLVVAYDLFYIVGKSSIFNDFLPTLLFYDIVEKRNKTKGDFFFNSKWLVFISQVSPSKVSTTIVFFRYPQQWKKICEYDFYNQSKGLVIQSPVIDITFWVPIGFQI